NAGLGEHRRGDRERGTQRAASDRVAADPGAAPPAQDHGLAELARGAALAGGSRHLPDGRHARLPAGDAAAPRSGVDLPPGAASLPDAHGRTTATAAAGHLPHDARPATERVRPTASVCGSCRSAPSTQGWRTNEALGWPASLAAREWLWLLPAQSAPGVAGAS